MRIIAIAVAGSLVICALAAPESAVAKSRSGYAHHHGKHHVRRHQHRRHYAVALRAPYSGPAFTLWQKRYEEPQWNPYEPFGYGTAYAPD